MRVESRSLIGLPRCSIPVPQPLLVETYRQKIKRVNSFIRSPPRCNTIYIYKLYIQINEY